MSAICALCKANGDLQNSHIIPEFFFKLIYDPKPRRFHVVSATPSERDRFEQKGLRERLLCRACEQKFGQWENYAKTALVDSKGVRIVQRNDNVLFQNIDYKTFKLFQLSLLWRMSVSTLDFFKEVALGPHEERIRQALLTDDPLGHDQYPCWLIAVQLNGKPHVDWIMEPSLTRADGHRIYWLVITGILFAFFVSSHPPPPEITPFILNRQNEMAILIKESTEIPLLADALHRLGGAIHARKKTK